MIPVRHYLSDGGGWKFIFKLASRFTRTMQETSLGSTKKKIQFSAETISELSHRIFEPWALSPIADDLDRRAISDDCSAALR